MQNIDTQQTLSVYRCPLYYHVKFAFLVWLQLPTIEVPFAKSLSNH